MTNLRFIFNFITAAMALIILTSCSNPVSPDGMTLGNVGQTPGEDTTRPHSIADDFALLRQNAQSGTSHEILVKNDEQLNSTLIIYFPGRQDIEVTIRSHDNTRRILSVYGNRAMFQVQGQHTLILENIALHGHHGNSSSIVTVGQTSTLKMNTDSVIRGNYGRGVSVNGGDFIMNNNASISGNFREGVQVVSNGIVEMNDSSQIYDNSTGVIAMDSDLIMNDDAAIHNNRNTGNGFRAGGVFLSGHMARLFMYDDAQIRYNSSSGGYRGAGGVLVAFGRIYMYGNAAIRHNHLSNSTGAGGVTLVGDGIGSPGGVLNMHSDNARINNNTSPQGGGVWMGYKSHFNISGGTIENNFSAPWHFPNLFIALTTPWTASIARVGSYTLSGVRAVPGTFAAAAPPVGDYRPSSHLYIEVSLDGSTGSWQGDTW